MRKKRPPIKHIKAIDLDERDLDFADWDADFDDGWDDDEFFDRDWD
ncbi:MAG: hypothetical protein ACTSYO_08480 [Candidatus Ranarchaeia archaeon]